MDPLNQLGRKNRQVYGEAFYLMERIPVTNRKDPEGFKNMTPAEILSAENKNSRERRDVKGCLPHLTFYKK